MQRITAAKEAGSQSVVSAASAQAFLASTCAQCLELGPNLPWEERGAILALLGSAERAREVRHLRIPWRPCSGSGRIKSLDSGLSLPTGRRRVLGLSLLACTIAVPDRTQDLMGTTGVRGAGSTFAYPIISLAGMLRVKVAAVDFAASDVPLKSPELTRLGPGQFPIVVGRIAIVVNLEGVAPGQLRLTGPVLAGLFLGKIKNWSDPSISVLNPELKLPNLAVALIHRSDGSGTTFNFTNYLTKVSPQWQERVGSESAGAVARGYWRKRQFGCCTSNQTNEEIDCLCRVRRRISGQTQCRPIAESIGPPFRQFHHEGDAINDLSCVEKVAGQLRARGYREVAAFRLTGSMRDTAWHYWLDDYNAALLAFFSSYIR